MGVRGEITCWKQVVGERDGTGVLFLPILCWLLQFLSLHLLKSWHHRIENAPPGAFSLFSRRIKACSSHFDTCLGRHQQVVTECCSGWKGCRGVGSGLQQSGVSHRRLEQSDEAFRKAFGARICLWRPITEHEPVLCSAAVAKCGL